MLALKEEGGLSKVFADRGGALQMRTSTLFDAKNFGFFEIFGVSAWTRGRGCASADILWIRGNFSRFCADVLYGWPLSILNQNM